MWEGWWGMFERQGSEQDVKRIIKIRSKFKFQVLFIFIILENFMYLKNKINKIFY